MVSLRRTLLAILHLVAVVAVAPGQGGDADSDGGEEEVPMVVTFVNELPDTTIELYWEDVARGERRVEASVPPRGGFVDVKTVVGHGASASLSSVNQLLLRWPGASREGCEYHLIGNIIIVVLRLRSPSHRRVHARQSSATTSTGGGTTSRLRRPARPRRASSSSSPGTPTPACSYGATRSSGGAAATTGSGRSTSS